MKQTKTPPPAADLPAGRPAARDQAAFDAFRAVCCPVCKGIKQKHTAFCKRCYYSLPGDLKNALWQRFGEGFEGAFFTAKEWLERVRA